MSNDSSSSTSPITSSSVVVDVGMMNWERWLQMVGFQVILGGIMGFVTNMVVGIGIAKSQKLRTRFYVSLCFLTLTRATISFQYIIRGSYYALRTAGILPSSIPLILCQHLHFFNYISSFTEELLLLFLVIDRTLAILRPSYYRQLTTKQAVWICIGLQLVAVAVRWIPAYIGVEFMKLVECVSIYSGLPKFFEVEYQHIALVSMILCVVLYFLMMFITCFRARGMRRLARDSEQYVALKRQLALLPVLRNTAGCHVALALLTRFSLTMGTLVPSNTTRFYAYAGVFQSADLFFGAVIMVLSKRELRDASLPGVFKKVSTMNVTSTIGPLAVSEK